MNLRPILTCAECALLLLFIGCKKDILLNKSPVTTQATARPSATSSVITQTFDLPIRVDSSFVWGVNGHPLTQVQYLNNLGVQMSLLQELQAPNYRIDFNCDSNGHVDPYWLSSLSAAISSSHVNLLPVMIWPSNVLQLPLAQAEAAGRTMAQGFVQSYGYLLTTHYYELGNEVDLQCITGPDGESEGNYSTAYLNVAYAYFKGMIEGIKSVDPAAKTIINSGNHTLFFQLLNRNNVPFDIIGYHFYSGVSGPSGLISKINTLNTNPQDIWFTEVNDDNTLNDPSAQGDTIEKYIQALDQQSKIKGFFVYELFNQNDQIAPENIYGMTSWLIPFNYSSTIVRKPEFETYKFKIEEQKNGWYDLAYSTFLYCDFRQPDPGGLQFWTNWLISNRNIPLMFNIILPQENYSRWVNQQFELFVNRQADSIGLAYWTQQLVNGMSRESVIVNMLNGPEFWSLSGSTNTGFIKRSYAKLLNRGPSNAELTNWLNAIQNGTAAWQIVANLLGGTEYQGQYVLNEYNEVLRRAYHVTQNEIDSCVGLMQGGMTQLDLYKSMLNSHEFYARAIKEGYSRNNPGYTF